jgi:transcriptional regulator with XRE-family HTH domain
MTLADWMAENGMDDEALAAALEIDRSTASRFRRGKLLPSSKAIERIASLTNGQVQPNTFFGLPPAADTSRGVAA